MQSATTMTTWSPTAHPDYDALMGLDVYSSGGERLCKIEAILHPPADGATERGEHRLLIKPGGLKAWLGGGKELYVPESAISVVAENGVGLAYPKQAIAGQGWDEQPADLDRPA